jgi:hypothetical protein
MWYSNPGDDRFARKIYLRGYMKQTALSDICTPPPKDFAVHAFLFAGNSDHKKSQRALTHHSASHTTKCHKREREEIEG